MYSLVAVGLGDLERIKITLALETAVITEIFFLFFSEDLKVSSSPGSPQRTSGSLGGQSHCSIKFSASFFEIFPKSFMGKKQQFSRAVVRGPLGRFS